MHQRDLDMAGELLRARTSITVEIESVSPLEERVLAIGFRRR
jgi:hypothetical protein